MAEKSLNLNQTRFLQPLRSNTVHSQAAGGYKAAIEDIAAIQNSLSGTTHSDGISVVARYYDENGVGKSVLGIYSQVTNSFTYFVHDNEAIEKIIERVGGLEEKVGSETVINKITTEIQKLDVDTIGGEGKIITSVSETDGKISATVIDATASNIAVKDDSNLFTADNVEGVLTEIETALNQEIKDRADADSVLEGKIADAEAAAKAAATIINEKSEGFVKVSGVQNSETKAWTYTISEDDIASAKALEDEIKARTDADSALDERLDVIEGEAEGSIKKAVADAKSELIGDAAEGYRTLGDLEDKIQAVEGAAKSYSIVEVKEGLGANIEKAYQLQETVGENSVLVGSLIELQKDDSLVSVKLVNANDEEDENGQYLQFIYNLSDGTEKTVKIDVTHFLAESEFKNGLQVNESGEVSVKIDAASEGFLTVGEDGIKLSGVQDAIDAAQGAGESAAADALQDAKDYTDEKIGELDFSFNEGVGAGQAITSVSQTDGKIAAEYGDIAASHVTVSTINGITSTTVQDTLAELEGEIATLDAAAVKSIKVNNVEGSFSNGAASVTIEGDNIVVSSEYGDAVTYPTLSNTDVTFTAVKGSDTVNNAIKQLDQNVATLVQEVLKNEEVTAAALTKHNESAGFDENANYIVNESATYISAATSLAEADNLLDAAINQVSNSAISVVGGNGISVTGESTEKTITAVAKEGDSLIEVTENGIGIKEGGYIDCGTF